MSFPVDSLEYRSAVRVQPVKFAALLGLASTGRWPTEDAPVWPEWLRKAYQESRLRRTHEWGFVQHALRAGRLREWGDGVYVCPGWVGFELPSGKMVSMPEYDFMASYEPVNARQPTKPLDALRLLVEKWRKYPRASSYTLGMEGRVNAANDCADELVAAIPSLDGLRALVATYRGIAKAQAEGWEEGDPAAHDARVAARQYSRVADELAAEIAKLESAP